MGEKEWENTDEDIVLHPIWFIQFSNGFNSTLAKFGSDAERPHGHNTG